MSHTAPAPTCQRALKEWAVQCLALGRGHQAVVLRKGGLRDVSPGFLLPDQPFWLYPTQFHQSAHQLVPSAEALVSEVASQPPPAGRVPLLWQARIVRSWWLPSLELALAVQPWQLLSAQTVAGRFAYRQPGLTALLLEVAAQPTTQWVVETAAMQGCHSWVDLDAPLPVEPAPPVLNSTQLAEIAHRLDQLLSPQIQ